jgi:hypothetical protein
MKKEPRVDPRAIVVFSLLGGTLTYGFWSWFVYDVHNEITEAAISSEFLDKGTLKRIHAENQKCDDKDTGKYDDHALHFDSEEFEAGCSKLALNLNAAIDYLSVCEKSKALEKIGEALHGVNAVSS